MTSHKAYASFLGFLLLSTVRAAVEAPLPSKNGRYILITAGPATAPCLQESFYGQYASALGHSWPEYYYLPSAECSADQSALENLNGIMLPLDMDLTDRRLIWIGPAGVASEINPNHFHYVARLDADETFGMMRKAEEYVTNTLANGQNRGSQRFYGLRDTTSDLAPLEIMLSADNAGTGHVHKDLLPILDLLLPTHISVVALPERPMPHPKASFDTMDNDWGVPHKYAMRLATFTDQLEHDPSLATVVDSINVDTLRRNVRWLTGEAPSGIESRHSFTKGALQAAHWIKKQVQEAGASCELMHYMEGFAPNVICEFPNNSSEHVVLSAHYDSRGSFGMTRAPGADDDASGSGHLLGVVDAIKRYKIKFDKKVIVAFFSGEEQGLFGSRAYAGHLKDTNREVLLHIQADMLGYHVPGEPMQLALPATIHLPEASYFVGNVSKLYSPELVVGSTQACCSDHQSFLSLGFPATQVFERNGPIADPMYHNSGDLSFREGYDFDQIVAIAKVTMASIMIVAGGSLGICLENAIVVAMQGVCNWCYKKKPLYNDCLF